jgi:extracellular factor (EF) 3-hydroxypalmitic acid methyl ester biosynthesis protein
LENTLQYLTSNDWALMATKAERVAFALGHEIIIQGTPNKFVYIIRHGSASVELATPRSTVTLAVLEQGDICGEMAFLHKGMASATVVAKDMEVVADVIHVDDLQQLINTFPGFAARLFQSLALMLAKRLQHALAELIRNGRV